MPARLRDSLSVRLLVLVMATVLLIDLLYFFLAMQHECRNWLHYRLTEAQLVVLAAGPSPMPASWPALRTLSRAEVIRVLSPGPPRLVLSGEPTTARAGPAVQIVDMDRLDWLGGIQLALTNLRSSPAQIILLSGPVAQNMRLELTIRQPPLARFLQSVAISFLAIAVSIACVLGVLLFGAVRAMLVAPLLRITHSIAAFRTDPERAVLLETDRGLHRNADEIGLMGQELALMQTELRTALWRNARLAAVGTAVAKMSHDLRGILSSAMLVADRMTTSQDSQARHAGEVIVRCVQRATALAQHTLDFVREGPPPLVRSPVPLRALAAEAAASACGEPGRACAVSNQIDAAMVVNADAGGLLRVLTNLLRNAAQAGARTITLSATGDDASNAVLAVIDDGPGLPDAVRERLFRPFSQSGSGGSGLGLAIARDLMRAHGGDLRLTSTSHAGTCFSMYLQQPKPDDD